MSYEPEITQVRLQPGIATRVEHTDNPCRHCSQPLDYLPTVKMRQHTEMRYDCQCGKAEPEVL